MINAPKVSYHCGGKIIDIVTIRKSSRQTNNKCKPAARQHVNEKQKGLQRKVVHVWKTLAL